MLAAAFSATAQHYSSHNSQKPTWEVVQIMDGVSDQPSTDIKLEVESGEDGTVLISVDQATTIKVYSILGQLITQKQVNAGTVRLHIAARGIYILKAGSATRRISL